MCRMKAWERLCNNAASARRDTVSRCTMRQHRKCGLLRVDHDDVITMMMTEEGGGVLVPGTAARGVLLMRRLPLGGFRSDQTRQRKDE